MSDAAPPRATRLVGGSRRPPPSPAAEAAERRDSDRGQVGIGTLIVFIALVLVAAIAAGVLINTAGFLQTQAEDTGTESTQQVADNLNVITTIGTIDNETEAIGTVRIGVQPAAGADDLNLEDVTIQYVSDDSFANLVHVKDATVDGEGTVFNTEAVTAEDGEDNVMTGNSDRYELVLPLNESHPFYEVTTEAPDDDTDVDEDEFVVLDEEGEVVEAITFEETVDGEELEGFQEDIGDEADDGDFDGEDGFTLAFVENLNNAGDLDDLGEGEEAELTFTTETAAQTRAILQTPESLAGEDDGSAIDL